MGAFRGFMIGTPISLAIWTLILVGAVHLYVIL